MRSRCRAAARDDRRSVGAGRRGRGCGTGAGIGTNAPQQPAEPLPGVGPAQPQPSDTGKPRPVQITSLTKDMKASQVTNLMKEAEDLMKNGKYTKRLGQVRHGRASDAQRSARGVGSSDGGAGRMVLLAADAHLHEAFTKNPALLMGQYDLTRSSARTGCSTSSRT